jgi:UDP-glucuronate 4-epimerase
LLAAGQDVEQYGDGRSARDYTFVSDIVDGIVRALDRSNGFHVWNLGGSQTTTLGRLIEAIAAGLGVPARVRRLPAQPGDVERTWADVGRAGRELGWKPEVPFDRGLEIFLDWFRDQQRVNRPPSASGPAR